MKGFRSISFNESLAQMIYAVPRIRWIIYEISSFILSDECKECRLPESEMSSMVPTCNDPFRSMSEFETLHDVIAPT